MDMKTLILNPWVSLFWGYLGLMFHISSKPEGESLWGVGEWIKTHSKTFVLSVLSWFVVWALWGSGILGTFFPATMGPICFFFGMSANSLIDHIGGQIQEAAKRKTVTL
jgi:hypothetical protein